LFREVGDWRELTHLLGLVGWFRVLNGDIDLAQKYLDEATRLQSLSSKTIISAKTLEEIRSAVRQIGATRVVIDSISGFEMALAPAFREDFRESLYRLIGALTGLGVTIFSTVEVVEREGNTGLQITGYQLSFLTDDIHSQRYLEIDGELRKALVVVKMRGSTHNQEFRTYEITADGVELGESLRSYEGIITGMPNLRLLPLARKDST
jgi:circadian clock protein KaiC